MAAETTYQLVTAKPYGRGPRPATKVNHVFAGMGQAFCGLKFNGLDFLDMGLHEKAQILNGKNVCKRCKIALVNRDGRS